MKIIAVEWVDSSSMSGWVKRNELCCDSLIITSVGYLIEENDDNIVITSSYNVDEYISPLTIPKCSIIKRRFIKDTK